MTTIIKLGGSLITDKQVEQSYRADVVARLADEIRRAREAQPELELIIGHGSGSFGHFTAKQHGTAQGVYTAAGWRGFAQVGNIAAELNGLVAGTLQAGGVPVWRIQPSASVMAVDGVITDMALTPLIQALKVALVPLVYGDVALDEARGGTIVSTESIITYLCGHIPIQRVILVGEVAGVLDEAGAVIPHITPQNIERYRAVLGGSAGVDVTGGMLTKVMDMLAIARSQAGLRVYIIDGRQAGLLQDVLLDEATAGTKITA